MRKTTRAEEGQAAAPQTGWQSAPKADGLEYLPAPSPALVESLMPRVAGMRLRVAERRRGLPRLDSRNRRRHREVG